MISTTTGSFGKRDACNKRRAFTMALEDKKGSAFYKSVIILTEIRNLLMERIKTADYSCIKPDEQKALYNRIVEAFEENNLGYEPTQMKYHAYDACRQIVRFVSSLLEQIKLGLKPIPKLFASSQNIYMGENVSCKVKPDLIFVRGNSIEVVKLHCSKPQMTQKTVSDGKDISSLELYSLLLYGRKFAIAGHEVHIRASVYYLRKDNDRSSMTDSNFDKDFFNLVGGKNIVSIEETYVDRGYTCCMMNPEADHPCDDLGYEEDCPYAYICMPEGGLTALDRRFRPTLSSYASGLNENECDQDDCKACDLYGICKYTAAPISINKEPVTRTLRGIALSDTQKEIIGNNSGISLVNAAAGSGKTFCVCVRAVTLRNSGYAWKDMMLVTYTNTAAEEMKARIQLYNDDIGPGDDVSDMTICTFDSFGNSIIQEQYEELGFTTAPKVIDDVERSIIISKLLSKHPINGLDYRNFSSSMKTCMGALAMAKKVFGIIKAGRYTAADYDQICDELGAAKRFCTKEGLEGLIDLYDEYDHYLTDENLLEFPDMMGLLYEVLKRDPWYLEKFGFKHITVDEFQDSNQAQIDLIKKLWECSSAESLMVVGDDAQAIYGFRNTSPEYIRNFKEIMEEEVTEIDLVENRRSTPEICEFANKIYAMNEYRTPKLMKAIRPSGKPVVVKGFVTKDEERLYVLNEIKSHLDAGMKPEDIAIICHTKFELMTMADLLTKENIQSVMLNPELLCENSRVIAALAMVNAIADRYDTKDLLVYANARIGGGLLEKSYEEIEDIKADANKRLEVIRSQPAPKLKRDAVIEAAKEIDDTDEVYLSFLDTLAFKSTYDQLVDYCGHFVEYGGQNAVRRTHDYPGIVLTTAHSSKGLEWPVVFDMISKYDTPELHKSSRISGTLLEEKRRLLFVSATRARDELYITGQYVAYGKRGDYHYNQFLMESADAEGIGMNATTIAAEFEAHKAQKEAEKGQERKEKTVKTNTKKKVKTSDLCA